MQDKGGVDNLKDTLYSRKHGERMRDVRAPLSPSEDHAPVHWEDSTPPSSVHGNTPVTPMVSTTHMGLATKFFIGSVVFFLIAIIGSAVFFFTGGNYISANNIDLEIIAPPLIDGGSEANLQFIITNRNPTELLLADLVITYPAGTRDPEDPTEALNHERISIGTIAPGRQVKLTSKAVFYGSEGSTQQIKASLEYGIAGSNAVFVKDNGVSLTVGSSPVSVAVEAPQEAIAGQPFTITVTVQSNAATPVEDVLIQAQYPFGFSVQTATPKADSGSTVWRLGTMQPGTTQVINIVGTIDGQDGDERVFRFSAGSTKDATGGRIQVPFLSVPASVTVHRPFIASTLSVNGKTGSKVSASAGQPLQGVINWQNNLSDAIQDVEIEIKLSGPALDRASISSANGFYQSNNSTIVWTAAQDPSLAAVAPGGRGSLSFSFAAVAPGAGGVVYTNPIIDLELSVRAKRSGQGNVPSEVLSAASMEVSLASAVSLGVQTLRSSGPFTNTGPIPPRAEVSTTYTVAWTIKNSSNAIGGASVSTVLPPYVNFVGAAQGSGIVYDSSSRTVKWDIGDIKAGVGYSTVARQGSFQVSLTPSISQIGQVVSLTGGSSLTGTDRFAQTAVSASAEPTTTRFSDAGFAPGMDEVAPKQ